jgi:hypothetical protein
MPESSEPEATHVAVEMPVFQALMQLLDTLPHGQVRQLHDALSQSKALSSNSAGDSHVTQ